MYTYPPSESKHPNLRNSIQPAAAVNATVFYVQNIGPMDAFALAKNRGYTPSGNIVHMTTTILVCKPGPPPYYRTPVPPPATLAPSQLVCQNRSDSGASYRGFLSHTVQGKQCQDWDSKVPANHALTEFNFPGMGLIGPYCRAPTIDWLEAERKSNTWCFTTEPTIR